jgi:Holliday junction resolvasome RuvABC endonuclease subunit
MTNLRRATDRFVVVGFDPSLRNWGVAKGIYVPAEKKLVIEYLDVIHTQHDDSKQVRNNSKDLETAQQLCKGAWEASEGAQAIFVEVPHGSQSARAMASYGICVGVLGALRTAGIPFFEVSESEVKKATTGNRKATKTETIAWAMAKHPEAPWPMYSRNGQLLVSEAKAEHMADAIGAIYAGLASKPFQQLIPFITP